MKPTTPKRQRCAIYTRKSTEHNLDLAFNSLDAQREACEAYIKSQAHEGWTLLPASFDDGGLSGAFLDRPALQKLLDLVRARKVNVIVVYKVDRLTRSLADFAKLVELFDAHDVSFVSITQSFNTTSSMGRLTLNVLLSFAQFEREVIGERVRDKIAASKRKGLWVGGSIPLGYRSIQKKLQIVPEEADLVRKIFADYLRLGSIAALAGSLEADGLRPKPRLLADGRSVQASRFMVGPLAHLLKNRFYVGEVFYRGEVYPGEQGAIVDRAIFDEVQARLLERAVNRRLKRSQSPHLLTGLIFDDAGHPMSPTHATKKGTRYVQGRKREAGTTSRVSASAVEGVVVDAVRTHLAGADRVTSKFSDGELIQSYVEHVTVHPDRILLQLHAGIECEEAATSINITFNPSSRPRKGIAYSPAAFNGMTDQTRDALLAAIVRSRGWLDAIMTEQLSSFEQIAESEKLAERHVRFLAPLAYLSPRIVDAIAEGRAPTDLNVSSLARKLSLCWKEQEVQLGLR
jgi:site-specific DNA recombinase